MAKGPKSSGEDLVDSLSAAGTPLVPDPPVASVPDVPSSPSAAAPAELPVGGAVEPVQPATPTAPVGQLQQAAATQAAAEFSLLKEVAGLGFENVTDELEASRRLLEAYRLARLEQEEHQQRMQLLQPWAQLGQQAWQQSNDPSYQAAMAQRPAPAPAAPSQPAAPDPWWKLPTLDVEELAHYRTDVVGPDGKTAKDWRPDTPLEVRQKYAQYEHKSEQIGQRIVRDFYGSVKDVAEQIVQPLLEAKLQEFYAARIDAPREQERVMSFIDQKINDNADWLFVKDPVTGRPLEQYTPDGQQMYNWLVDAGEIGITDPQHKWRYAETQRQLAQLQRGGSLAGSPVQPVTPQAPPAPLPTRGERNADYLKAAAQRQAPAQSRGAAVATPAGVVRNRNVQPGELLIQQMRADGITV